MNSKDASMDLIFNERKQYFEFKFYDVANLDLTKKKTIDFWLERFQTYTQHILPEIYSWQYSPFDLQEWYESSDTDAQKRYIKLTAYDDSLIDYPDIADSIGEERMRIFLIKTKTKLACDYTLSFPIYFDKDNIINRKKRKPELEDLATALGSFHSIICFFYDTIGKKRFNEHKFEKHFDSLDKVISDKVEEWIKAYPLPTNRNPQTNLPKKPGFIPQKLKVIV